MGKIYLKYESEEINRRLDLAGTALQEHQDISNLATKKEVSDGLAKKVDKVSGKQLSTEDYTTAEKTKLRGLYNYDDATVKESIKTVEDKVKTKQDIISDLATIREGANKGATAIQEVKTINGEPIVGSGNIEIKETKPYDDSEIKEQINSIQNTIPTNVSQLVNDKGYLTKHQDISHLATKDELIGKVDKEPGKQLTTEDFTTVLKAKLEGLNNYDDTVILSALNTLRKDLDAIVSGDTTSAIKTFNEIIAFLEGIQDTQDLSNIIAAIEQQIASVYNAIPANISQLNNDSGFIAQVKTINGESIEGEGDIVIEAGGDTTSLEKVVAASITDLDTRVKKLVNEDNKIKADVEAIQNDAQTRATKSEVSEADANITTEIKSNERVTAAAINNLYETKADKAYVDDAIISAITNTINASY